VVRSKLIEVINSPDMDQCLHICKISNFGARS